VKALGLAVCVAILLAAPAARAGEAQVEVGGAAAASTWRKDLGGGSLLRFGYRLGGVVAVDVVTWEQFFLVNHRLNTGLTLGISGFWRLATVRPSGRFYFIHQHEEALVSIEDHPFGTVFGIGAGIRHRAGGGVNLGVEIPLRRMGVGELYLATGGSMTWFPDAALGPSAYFGLNAGVGFNLSGAP
jgi:hypothetical protein